MVNYENGKIYKIWSTLGDKIYVGSTTKERLCQRMENHRGAYRSWQKGIHNFITSFSLFDEYGLENCFIELLEAKECQSRDELNKTEGKYIRELDCVNKMIAGRTSTEYALDVKEKKKQYEIDHKEQIKERKRLYRIENKEAIQQKSKQYYIEHKDEIKQYREENQDQIKEKTKQYRLENKEQLSQSKKEYYIANKERIEEHRSERTRCECGGIYRCGDKTKHFKTKKHSIFIENKNK